MTPCWKYCSQTTATTTTTMTTTTTTTTATTTTMTTTMTTTATTTTTGGNKQAVETPFEKGEKQKLFFIKMCFLLLVSFEGKKEKGLKTETTV